MKAIFITGTDTGVGKTKITGLLAGYFLEKKYSVITQKWIQSGKDTPGNYTHDVCVYNFGFASSPHLTANLEKRKIYKEKIKKSFRALTKKFDFVIVEGIGGALVPFNKKELVIDIAKELNLPVLIVAANKLGAINHTLLTIEAIKRRKMKIIGIIFNNVKKDENKIILKDNPKIIKALTREPILGILPYKKDKNKLYKAFLPIGGRVLNLKSQRPR